MAGIVLVLAHLTASPGRTFLSGAGPALVYSRRGEAGAPTERAGSVPDAVRRERAQSADHHDVARDLVGRQPEEAEGDRRGEDHHVGEGLSPEVRDGDA